MNADRQPRGDWPRGEGLIVSDALDPVAKRAFYEALFPNAVEKDEHYRARSRRLGDLRREAAARGKVRRAAGKLPGESAMDFCLRCARAGDADMAEAERIFAEESEQLTTVCSDPLLGKAA